MNPRYGLKSSVLKKFKEINMKKLAVLSGIVSILFIFGCNSTVPPGHVGMVRTPQGLHGDILAPGLHSCWGRDHMQLVEVSDKTYRQKMDVLCTDELNFGFSVHILAAVDKTQSKLIKSVFENVTPSSEGVVTAKQLYDMYVKPVVDQEARKSVGKYATSELVRNRLKVIQETRQAIKEALKGGIMKVRRVSVTNLDFPDSITKAQEKKATRRVEIQTEKAEQEKRIVIAKNKIKTAQLEYKRRLIEAAMIADANKIIGSSLSQEYLAWWQLKVFSKAALGNNNWGFIPYTDHTNGQKFSVKKLVIDASLRRRIEDAQKAEAERTKKSRKKGKK
jgi:regulator of protease activity HflC (stomatin/prohibitin superfamily)